MNEGQPSNSDGSWQFNPDGAPATAVQPVPAPVTVDPRSVAIPPTGADGGISWTASEFVAHHKNSGWYGLLAVGAVGAAVVVWLVTKDVVSAIFIIIAAVMFGVFAGRQPRELAYRLDESGLTVGRRFYHYGTFRSFAVITEGAFASIVFTPLKRFAPLTTIYYDPRDEEKIVDLLSDRLPLEDRRRDAIDRLMWRIRF